ncbi:TetR/AcrR family transcriptional regulator [Aeromicrobium halocynthiae]|uniref:TetR/AcrR family transcriptional regulator n=1 Tax=Aeromicrobium halocynthiae TaxID=560557 RepID=UPI0031DC788B
MSRGRQRSRGTGSVVAAAGETVRQPPATTRGARTRANLVHAARFIFERDGYLDARLTDITAQAQCSTGSFYTYFDSKEEIFRAVLEAAKEDMMHPGMARIDNLDDPRAVIEASNRAYFEAYQRNAKLMGLLEQVASIDPEFRELRRKRSGEFSARNARGIERLKAQGLVDPELDALFASRALSAMVSRLAYYTFVLGESAPLDDLVEVSTRLWCNALRLQ